MSKRAVLYARVSGDDRGREGRNLAGQLDMCREYAHKRGYVIVAELAEDDRGASGASFELPRLNEIRELAQTGLIDVLVVREIDRLSRNLAKQLIVEDELKRAGVSIEYVLGEYPDTPEGSLMKHVRASISEYERLKIIERMVRGRYLKAKSGSVLVAKHPPFGYSVQMTKDGKKYVLEIHESEAQVVRLIFQWYTMGDGTGAPLGSRVIANKLNKMGVPTASNPIRKKCSRQWSCSAVRGILKNKTYLGNWAYGKTRGSKRNPIEKHITVRVSTIIDQEMWESAQERLRRGKENFDRRMEHEYLMGHRLRCGICKRSLRVNSLYLNNRKGRKLYKYYMCAVTSARRAHCQGIRCNSDRIDPVVWEWVKSLLLDPKQLEDGLKAYREAGQVETAQTQEQLKIADELLRDHKEQLNRLLDLYLSGEFKMELLVERKTRLESTIAALERERAEIASRIDQQMLSPQQIETIKRFSEQVAHEMLSADETHAVQRQLIELLDVTGDLKKEGGEFVVYARCIIGASTLGLKERANCAYSTHTHPHPTRACPAVSARRSVRRQ